MFEHLSFEFLEGFDVFAPAETGRTRDFESPELMRGFLHCYYKDTYVIRPVTRELSNPLVWLSCGFKRLPLRDVVDPLLTDLEHVVEEVFDHLVEQAARRGLLDLTDSTDSTDVRAMPADPDVSQLSREREKPKIIIQERNNKMTRLYSCPVLSKIEDDTTPRQRLPICFPMCRFVSESTEVAC